VLQWRYSSAISLTAAIDGGEWSRPRPRRFTPWKETRYPFYRRLDGPRGSSERVWKISPSPRFNPRTVQPVASRCTEYGLQAPDPSSIIGILQNTV
jgi:hypothetical protein